LKWIIFYIIFSCINPQAFAQKQSLKDSLRALLLKTENDTTRVNILARLSSNYSNSSPDSQFLYAQEGLKLAQSIHYIKGEMYCKQNIAVYWWTIGEYATSIKLNYTVSAYAKAQQDTLLMIIIYGFLLNNYRDQGDYREALATSFVMIEMAQRYHNCSLCQISYAVAGSVYYEMKRFDSALYYLNKGINYPVTFGYGWVLLTYGRIQAAMKNSDTAGYYYKQSINRLQLEGDLKDLAGGYISLADLFEQRAYTDSAVYYGKKALKLAQEKKFLKEILLSYLFLAKIYENLNTKAGLSYYKLAMNAKDSLYNQDKQRQIVSYKFNEELRKQDVENREKQTRIKNRIYILLAILTGFLLFAIVLVRNIRHRQKAYALLQKQKQEIDVQKGKVEKTLEELKATQQQLIQSEKMASLGELTAGIAHEIQNPLNFVNNFSEVSVELVEDLKKEAKEGNGEEVIAIADEIAVNLQKVVRHGQRAEGIVKGMLQHSRASSGKKEPTNINALVSEYLGFSYHGLRAKDKQFIAILTTDFDESIGRIEIVPQDIGRVLLNLYNNAFYSLNQKKKQFEGTFEPTVFVSTRKDTDKITIIVSDNGCGIPQRIADKIFQPFFTTKPSGQGTGLGLSLSYDIIKAHGGEIRMESKEGEGTEFIIELPVA
jgi:two-component system NtrC family sensor kinase